MLTKVKYLWDGLKVLFVGSSNIGDNICPQIFVPEQQTQEQVEYVTRWRRLVLAQQVWSPEDCSLNTCCKLCGLQ